MARSTLKRQINCKLTDADRESIRRNNLKFKIRHRALTYAGISYGKFCSVFDTNTGLTRQQYQKLMAFCKQTELNHYDF